jgi:tripartite-type tricarboxylate transporter receptor subunit TctC
MVGATCLTLLCAILPLFPRGAQAQAYPSRQVRMIVPLAPGGGTDTVARLLAPRLSEQLAVSVLVENRGGAGTVIGTEALSKAAPDGYTVGVLPPEFSINPSLRKLPYDSLKDFTCVSQLTCGQYLLSTHPSMPVKTVRQFVALGKKAGTSISYASSGPGSANHLAGMWLQQLTGARLLHVPYKSAGLASIAVLGGEVDFMFSNTSTAIPHVRAGRLRAIGATGRNRSPVAPEVPTFIESGLPQFVVTGFYLLVGPAGVSPEVTGHLNREANRALENPGVKARFAELGIEAVRSSPADCVAFLKSEIYKWAPVIASSGMKPD